MYKLNLPESMPIHPVFNVDQLYLANNDLLPGQVQEPPLPVFIDRTPEHKVAEVIDCCCYGIPIPRLLDWI
jgi:hypothetical protein